MSRILVRACSVLIASVALSACATTADAPSPAPLPTASTIALAPATAAVPGGARTATAEAEDADRIVCRRVDFLRKDEVCKTQREWDMHHASRLESLRRLGSPHTAGCC